MVPPSVGHGCALQKPVDRAVSPKPGPFCVTLRTRARATPSADRVSGVAVNLRARTAHTGSAVRQFLTDELELRHRRGNRRGVRPELRHPKGWPSTTSTRRRHHGCSRRAERPRRREARQVLRGFPVINRRLGCRRQRAAPPGNPSVRSRWPAPGGDPGEW